MHRGHGWWVCVRDTDGGYGCALKERRISAQGATLGDWTVGMDAGHGRWGCIRDTDGGDASVTRMVGMHRGHGWWVCLGDTDGGCASEIRMVGVEARRFGGWGGASHDSQGVALGCHMLPGSGASHDSQGVALGCQILPRWGRNRSRASPPNPGNPSTILIGATLTKRLQAR